MSDWNSRIEAALAAGELLESSVKNLKTWLDEPSLPEWARKSIGELVEAEEWSEINDRFYQQVAFGTGGMRNRTISKILTKAEEGTLGPQGTPAHAAAGTAVLNDINVIRATMGLHRYCAGYLRQKLSRAEPPRLVIAHDVRHFSRHFCELAASVWSRLGGTAMIFDGPRSTPQLSFAVREMGATAGVVITASHNPAHDNGYKVYFEDGAQVVSPHAEGIIEEVYAVSLKESLEFTEIDLQPVVVLGDHADRAYLEVLRENLLDPTVFESARPKVVFTAIHGTGGVTGPAILRELDADVIEVEEQMVMDPRFPTVKSPNPENAEALSMAVAKAREVSADVVVATDPDADRMGIAVPDGEGGMRLLTGNMIGSLLAAYRTERMKEMGWLPSSGLSRGVLIKTFVTTPLQASIAEKNGLKVIDTLTGFKWIGRKLGSYEEQARQGYQEETGLALDYDRCSREARRQLCLKYSSFYVFGGEESYGYLASDRLRDKDANAAVVMVAELAAYLRAKGKTVVQYLDEIYMKYGYYLEDLLSIYYEGAAGASKISNILESFRKDPPKALDEFEVTAFRDFGVADFYDADGEMIPKQDFYFLELDNEYKVAVRGSGTEPKIKFYFFAKEPVSEPGVLEAVKEKARDTLDRLMKATDSVARLRAEG